MGKLRLGLKKLLLQNEWVTHFENTHFPSHLGLTMFLIISGVKNDFLYYL